MKRNVFPLQKLLFEKRKQPGARYPEGAVPILGLCHGVFTDQFIFRHILGHFSRENRISEMSMSEFEVEDIKKEN